ncbi:GATA zinc finger domain-containing protein 10 [Onthophagus taurus]|uniref:GATA zinc finger domain-containing protein 10 n=1 Tax=Onthophagus taurus TaxID=166361 RepID=UPI0039BEA028
MKLLATLVFVICVGGVISKTVKKSTEDAAVQSNPTQQKSKEPQIETNQPKKLKLKPRFSKKVPHQPPAIIAIEIIDPNDNSTKSKTSKRTIQSALGYGVPSPNSYGVTDKPKLVFYKYSQQDIPPYQGQPEPTQQNYNNINQNSQQNGNLLVQKSIRFDLGSTQHIEYPKHNQNYEPTTLFATLNPHGQVGGFTQNVPNQGHNAPIILLKVYTNQLGGAIYPNLPANHPYAGLNNVNLQNMLNNFYDKHFYQQPNTQQYQNVAQYQNNQQNYQSNQQNYETNQQNYQPQAQPLYTQVQNQGQDYYLNQPNQYHQQYQDNVQQYQYNQQLDYDGLITHENYPSDAHTRVVFHTNKISGKDVQQPQALPLKSSKYQQPQSYSSFEIHNQQQKAQDYDDYDYSQLPANQDYSLKQNQDDQGYYYYKPDIQTILQNIRGGKNNYQTIQQDQQDYQGNQQDYQGGQQDYQDYQGNQQDYQSSQQNYQDNQDYQGVQVNYNGGKQDYPSGQAEYQSPTEISGTLNEKGQVDTQKVVTPVNYHAHPNGSRGNKKRTVRRPESPRRINTPKIKVVKEE